LIKQKVYIIRELLHVTGGNIEKINAIKINRPAGRKEVDKYERHGWKVHANSFQHPQFEDTSVINIKLSSSKEHEIIGD
jgi:hypothetical protein